MTAEALHLVPSGPRTPPPAQSSELSVCAGCRAVMRPSGTTEAQYPGTVPEWGEHQCRTCDYLSAGKDPDDRFIPIERIDYLAEVRAQFEASRLSRGIPADGLRNRNRTSGDGTPSAASPPAAASTPPSCDGRSPPADTLSGGSNQPGSAHASGQEAGLDSFTVTGLRLATHDRIQTAPASP